MMRHFRTRVLSNTQTTLVHSVIYALPIQRLNFSKTLKMEPKCKRPMCPSCSKPAPLCLCIRIRNPGLDNSVTVTILQHSLERKHALNSTRIAKLGLKNLTVATVFDIDFEAQLLIRLLEPGCEVDSAGNGIESSGFDRVLESKESQKPVSEDADGIILKRGQFKGSMKCHMEKKSNLVDVNGGSKKQKCSQSLDPVEFSDTLTSDVWKLEPEDVISNGECSSANIFSARNPNLDTNSANSTTIPNQKTVSKSAEKSMPLGVHPNQDTPRCKKEPVVTATIGKHGIITDFSNDLMLQPHGSKLDFYHILASQIAMDALAKGFAVKRWIIPSNPKPNQRMEMEEHHEFEIEVPPGSVLLFPSENAVGVNDLKAMNFKVKNLIVLDGTWAKAKRMYVENPWLKLLPHLRLDLDTSSLYSEVRHQPKPGYLSTIESIVYAMKAIGECPEGLDDLLNVFESMVGDQRRCKAERLTKIAPK